MFRAGQAFVRFDACAASLHILCAVVLQVDSLSDNTDGIGEVVERNMDLVQAFLKSLLMVCQSTAVKRIKWHQRIA